MSVVGIFDDDDEENYVDDYDEDDDNDDKRFIQSQSMEAIEGFPG